MSHPALTPPVLGEDHGAKDWEYRTHAAVEVERNRWFVATIVAGLVAAGSITSVAVLLPLQRLVPMAVTVDSRTGLVTSVEYGRSVADLTQKEAIQRSDVAKYVVARETYDPMDLATNTKLVRVMSDGKVWRQYAEETSPYNDSSPMKRYGTNARRRIEVSTVLPLPGAKDTYQVRYIAIVERQVPQSEPVQEAYVATVHFLYSDRALSNEDRILNPLNFRALGYRSDREIAAANEGGNQ